MGVKKIFGTILPITYKKLATVKRQRVIRKFRRKNPGTMLFKPITDSSQRKLFSQHNQDFIIINAFFKQNNNGFYCDIGASHPVTFSNTLAFENIGWSGIAFDPMPGMKELWETHRKTRFHNLAISNFCGQARFLINDPDGSPGSVENMHSRMKLDDRKLNKTNAKQVDVEVMQLREIFEEENISHVDYMSVDVEGNELNVLHGIDWESISVDVLSIENNSGHFYLAGDPGIRAFMTSRGYFLYARILGLDDIYVHHDFMNSLVK